MQDVKNVNAANKGKMEVVATAPIYLSRRDGLKQVNLMLPPGISTFYVERVDKNHIRFVVPTKEITRLTDKSKKLKAAVESDIPAKV